MKITLPITYHDADLVITGRFSPARKQAYDARLGIGRPALLAEMTIERVELDGEDVTALHTARELIELRELALRAIDA